jgi:hypothetical protein
MILINFYYSNKSIFEKKIYNNVNNINYKLINDNNTKEAARLLDSLNQFVYVIIKQLKRELHSGQDFGKMNYFVKNLIKKYDPSRMEEGPYIREGEPGSMGEDLPSGDRPDSAYVINKGERIVMCLRDANGRFHDMNVLHYILVHEISHIGSTEEQHYDEFWQNFKWLMRYLEARGIYTADDYYTNPVKYCGTIMINENPIYINEIPDKEIIPDWNE